MAHFPRKMRSPDIMQLDDLFGAVTLWTRIIRASLKGRTDLVRGNYGRRSGSGTLPGDENQAAEPERICTFSREKIPPGDGQTMDGVFPGKDSRAITGGGSDGRVATSKHHQA